MISAPAQEPRRQLLAAAANVSAPPLCSSGGPVRSCHACSQCIAADVRAAPASGRGGGATGAEWPIT